MEARYNMSSTIPIQVNAFQWDSLSNSLRNAIAYKN